MGCICFLIMRALGELLLSNLEHHSFLEFIEDHLGKKAAFVTAGLIGSAGSRSRWLILTATGLYIRYWAPGIPQWLPEVIALVILLSLNLMAVRLSARWNFGLL
jgi:D-serine/D-alanine/glycine transporter